MLIEVCANSLQSALNAESAGADRIELCVELGVGGVTPTYGLIKLVMERLSIPVHVLIRPRGGHFTYSKPEFEVMLADIEYCKELGVSGIVSGVLQADHSLDVERTKILIEAAAPLNFSFHRAFDWVPDQKRALQQLLQMGATTILTSGQQLTAEAGIEFLQSLKESSTNIVIMPGGGIGIDNIHKFKSTGFQAIHLSGTSFENRVSVKEKIPMNSPKYSDEHQVAVTNEALVRQIIKAVK